RQKDRACRSLWGTASPHQLPCGRSPSYHGRREEMLQLHDVRAGRDIGAVKARHGLVVNQRGIDDAEAVELRAHRAAIGAEHPDLDIIAGPDISGKVEGAGHAVEVVAGWAIEAERHRAGARLLFADEANGIAPADVRGVEQRAIGTVVNVEFLA